LVHGFEGDGSARTMAWVLTFLDATAGRLFRGMHAGSELDFPTFQRAEGTAYSRIRFWIYFSIDFSERP